MQMRSNPPLFCVTEDAAAVETDPRQRRQRRPSPVEAARPLRIATAIAIAAGSASNADEEIRNSGCQVAVGARPLSSPVGDADYGAR
jgi:hypothetical protein